MRGAIRPWVVGTYFRFVSTQYLEGIAGLGLQWSRGKSGILFSRFSFFFVALFVMLCWLIQ
jgi:hypothetical protein